MEYDEAFLQKIKPNILDYVTSLGHVNVRGDHPTTLEITTEDFLTLNGDCIIGINASKGCHQLNPDLKVRIQRGDGIGIFLKAGNNYDCFTGKGNSQLLLTNNISMVFRKSTFISDRTVLIECTKYAQQINRDLIDWMQDPTHILELFFFNLDGLGDKKLEK
ncbi:MAG: DUF371 domain-containing protein [Promethearchaeota archaeon]